MADQPLQSDPATRAASDAFPPANSSIYSGLQQCPNCGAVTGRGDTVCQTCGEDLARRPRQIRCRHCHQSASSALVLCPHCGRELQAAPPRWLTWGVPVLLAGLFLLLLANRWERNNPLTWLQAQSEQLSGIISIVDAGMEPTDDTVIVATGNEMLADSEGSGSAVALVAAVAVDQAARNANPSGEAPVEAVEMLPTATAVPTTAPAATPEPSATSEPTATEVPTEAPTATPTAAPTSTPTPTDRPTTAPTAIARSTSQASTTAAAAGASVQNAFSLPTATPTPNAATVEARVATETAAGGGTGGSLVTTYTVRSGDTLLGIAAQFEVAAQALMAANDIAASEVYSIRPGDELIVPTAGESAVTPAATPVPPSATSTRQATSTPAPTATPTALAFRLEAPLLRSPENGTTVSCGSGGQLTWSQVDFIQPDDRFILHLGFVRDRDEDGNESITWVLQQPIPSSRSAWEMDSDLCSLAPQELGRRWQWYVEIADATADRVSPASATWEFTWN
jgi:LysM repeat protein